MCSMNDNFNFLNDSWLSDSSNEWLLWNVFDYFCQNNLFDVISEDERIIRQRKLQIRKIHWQFGAEKEPRLWTNSLEKKLKKKKKTDESRQKSKKGKETLS